MANELPDDQIGLICPGIGPINRHATEVPTYISRDGAKFQEGHEARYKAWQYKVAKGGNGPGADREAREEGAVGAQNTPKAEAEGDGVEQKD